MFGLFHDLIRYPAAFRAVVAPSESEGQGHCSDGEEFSVPHSYWPDSRSVLILRWVFCTRAV